MRAKFICMAVTATAAGTKKYKEAKLNAVYSNTPEDQQFSEATPSAQLTINISNQEDEVQNFFEPGKNYYLDFTPAP
jgi:hypothetical protein